MSTAPGERILVLDQYRGVKVGGRFDGWLMRRRDGQWITVRKLPTEGPYDRAPEDIKAMYGVNARIVAKSSPKNPAPVDQDTQGASATLWQPIETAPVDGTWILAHGDGPAVEQCAFLCAWSFGQDDRGHETWREIYSLTAMSPTHWMPLPPPPVEESR